MGRLVREHAEAKRLTGSERISVAALHYEDAHHLQVPIGGPAD